MNTEIKSVKIKDSKPVIVYFPLDENGEHQAEITYDKGPKCHPDFEKKLDELKSHAAMLTYFINPTSTKSIEDLAGNEVVNSFDVSQFNIGGKDEDQGVVIVGYRKLPNGKAFNFNTPFYKFNEGDESRYKFMDDLQLSLEDCKDEAIAYIKGEKLWKDPQLELELKTEDSQEAL